MKEWDRGGVTKHGKESAIFQKKCLREGTEDATYRGGGSRSSAIQKELILKRTKRSSSLATDQQRG